MKRLLLVCLAIVAVLIVTPAWSHHMAEGVISADVWEAVDAVLSQTPHGDLDLQAISDSMNVSMDMGYPALMSTLEVDSMDADSIGGFIETVVTTFNTFPSGNTNGGNADRLVITYVDTTYGTTLISIYEPIGMGNSQDVPSQTTPTRGNR